MSKTKLYTQLSKHVNQTHCIVCPFFNPFREFYKIMTTISTRPKSPTRAEAIAKALRPGPVFCTGVLLGKYLKYDYILNISSFSFIFNFINNSITYQLTISLI